MGGVTVGVDWAIDSSFGVKPKRRGAQAKDVGALLQAASGRASVALWHPTLGSAHGRDLDVRSFAILEPYLQIAEGDDCQN